MIPHEADCQIIRGNGVLGASHGKFEKQRELFYLLLSNSKWLCSGVACHESSSENRKTRLMR